MSDEKETMIPQPADTADQKFDPTMPLKMAENLGKGKMKLYAPIVDGEKSYDEISYDFTKMTGWEFAKALDSGVTGMNGRNTTTLTDVQALALFAAAAAKCTPGLDATDIKERLGAMDAIGAINIASLFFKSSLMAASLRITNE